MLDFDAPPVEFRVRGQVYYLDSVTLDDAARMSTLAESTPTEQIAAMQQLMASKVRCVRSPFGLWIRRKPQPQDALSSLSAVQQARLFGEWMSEFKARGVVPGESSGSAG